MPDTVFDQEAFGRLARDLLAALNLADQLDQTGEEGQEGKEGEPEPSARRRRPKTPKDASAPSSPSDAQADQDAASDEALDEREEGGADRLDREIGRRRRRTPARALAAEPLGAR